MFFLKWSYRNLLANKRRTIGIILFITLIISILITDLLFLEGASFQMKEALRNNQGDINLKSGGGSASNGLTYLDMVYRKSIDDSIRILQKYAQLIGVTGYSEGTVFGVEPSFLKYLNRNVSWIEKCNDNLQEGTAELEANLADKLNVKKGDFITIKVRAEAGMINTLQVKVDGIFIGSNLLYQDVVFINLIDQNLLWLTDNSHFCNEVRVYFKNDVSNDQLTKIYVELLRIYNYLTVDSPKLYPGMNTLFMSFSYYRYLVLFLFTVLNIVFIIIIYFSIQNIFFISFRRRRQELSTLLTYGMKPAWIKRLVVWESILIFLISLILAILCSFVAIQFLKNIRITNPSISELIIAIGGPRLCFAINWKIVPAVLMLFFGVTLFSAYKGANTYLKMEIREITSHI